MYVKRTETNGNSRVKSLQKPDVIGAMDIVLGFSTKIDLNSSVK